ncbi:DUF2235 domain-containing protein [Methylocapsa acidiphila]|uniref:DUF2235 domain-containing protein n=1 Tax=Methylocapsa acidiphila TaxID=133552 RepID=UPI00040610DE|nr:DUF2235 domain-containing protein [Methylocapsa acidiphila]
MASSDSKQLILLLDGTWNDADIGPYDTNIVRLRELINKSLEPDRLATGAKHFAGSREYSEDNRQRIIFYERGVGTGALVDRVFGGAFGGGLGDNVRRAYKFLSWYYAPGDQIFIFGFSRGAYTARSLVGLIACSGLLKRASCNPELEARVWDFYHTKPNDRLPSVFDGLTEHVHPREAFAISCVGVFDTVGALGVPLPQFRLRNREAYGFHNVDLGSITKCNLHALAIDEHREPFEATPWRKPKFQAFSREMTVEQVWFAGAHADVGGGYIPEQERRTFTQEGWLRKKALDDITLDWMLRRVRAHYPDFPVKLDDPHVWEGPDPSWATADQHNSRSLTYCVRPFVHRSINNYAGQATFWMRHIPYWSRDNFVGHDRHAEPLGEMVHISALERYGEPVPVSGRQNSYAPQSLKVTLPYIGATYAVPGSPLRQPRDVRVVDWDGESLDPTHDDGRSKVAALLLGRERIKTDFEKGCSTFIRRRPN